MKHYLLIATAFVALASCSDEFAGNEKEPVNEAAETAITFGSSTQAVTRSDYIGSAAAALLNNNFVVDGIKWNGSGTKENVFDHYNVNWVDNTAYTTTSNTNNWEYVGQTVHSHATVQAQTIKYWDFSKSQYDFIAYSKGTAKAVYSGTPADDEVLYTKITPNTLTTSAYTIKGKASELAKVYIADMVSAYRDDNNYQNVVQFKFRNLSSKVRIALYETVPGYSIKEVEFYTDDNTVASDGKAHLYTKGDANKFYDEGTYTVYYPTTGSGNKSNSDYNKAHLTFTAATSGTVAQKEYGKLTGSLTTATLADKESYETAGKLYLGRTANSAIFAGNKDDNYYTVVIPNETGAVINMKVNYTLVATDGGSEEIHVTGATATIPAKFATWKSGYAYTYLFKISDNTNGYTGPTSSPAGLSPITFDAVVLDDEADGMQETITTVSEPNITTFGYNTTTKKFVVSGDEYALGTRIYAVIVKNGEVLDPVFMTKTHIYKVTSSDDNYAISEASVAEAVEHPTGNKLTLTHVCTPLHNNGKDAQVSKIPAENGSEKSVNAIWFEPETSGTYAIRYINATPSGFGAGTVLDAGTSLDGYYTYDGEKYVACAAAATADGTTEYYLPTYASGSSIYKIVKVE